MHPCYECGLQRNVISEYDDLDPVLNILILSALTMYFIVPLGWSERLGRSFWLCVRIELFLIYIRSARD